MEDINQKCLKCKRFFWLKVHMFLSCDRFFNWMKMHLATLPGRENYSLNKIKTLQPVAKKNSKNEKKKLNKKNEKNNDLHFVGCRSRLKSGWWDQERVCQVRPPGGGAKGSSSRGWRQKDPRLLVGNHQEQTTFLTGKGEEKKMLLNKNICFVNTLNYFFCYFFKH